MKRAPALLLAALSVFLPATIRAQATPAPAPQVQQFHMVPQRPGVRPADWCYMTMAITETTNSDGDPGMSGHISILYCSNLSDFAYGNVYLEHQNPDTGDWEFPAKTGYAYLYPGQTYDLFYRHNSHHDFGNWRLRWEITTGCPDCIPAHETHTSAPAASGRFFEDWGKFESHYEDHVVIKNDWGHQITKWEYLDSARSASLYAEMVYQGLIPDSNYLAGVRSSDNALIGYDRTTRKAIILHVWNQTYPYFGTHFVWSYQEGRSCKTGEDWWRYQVYRTQCP